MIQNREIKFRGKRVTNGEWVYGDLKNHMFGDTNRKVIICLEDGVEFQYEVDPKTVGQYLGFNINGGTEVYEDDFDQFGYIVTYVGDIKAGLGLECGWYLQRHDFESYSLVECDPELIIKGNIHDNPESALLSIVPQKFELKDIDKYQAIEHYCHECNKQVKVKITNEVVISKIAGLEIAYEAVIPHCECCGHEVYISEIHDANIAKGHEAYKKAREK